MYFYFFFDFSRAIKFSLNAQSVQKNQGVGWGIIGRGAKLENKRTFFGIFSGFFLLFFAEILYEFFVSAWPGRSGQPNNYLDGQHNLMNIGNDEK